MATLGGEERAAFLCFNDWVGYHEEPIVVVGETPKRYRIRADKLIRLAGRNRFLPRGKMTLVPRTAVRFPDRPRGKGP
jgi:hypothetical protein